MVNKFGLVLATGVAFFASAHTAHAFCTDSRADVSILCPKPVPFRGKKDLTETSRNLPTVGTPGVYKNYGNGYDVRVYLYQNGTGHQPFHWEKQ
ncbi:hypothetical protein [Candidatus Rhodobacter oscarellae]|uniref:hypothetical protein n=1 Tax=Candidatus Rhodobacter oscarellae TaxID=1675527 RepID=UPI00128ECA4E|nr:hypothetical protein [Candidatus Rhodobacter lobularis]